MGQTTVEGAPVQVELAIEGMTCASCVRRVERALTGVDGVTAARVNLATESAAVVLSGRVAPEALVRAVTAAGYTAAPRAVSPDPAAEAAARQASRAVALRRLGHKLALGVTFSTGILVLAYAFPDQGWSRALQLVGTLPVFVWVGAGFHRGALASLRHRTANMDTLVSLGSGVAFGYSVVVTLAQLRSPTYFDVAAVIVTLISVGKYLEALTRGRAGEAIESLATLTPQRAHLLSHAATGEDPGRGLLDISDISAEALRPGDVVLVRPGELLPADGIVVDGASAVEESMVTGESVPAPKTAGDAVTGGTLNGLAPLRVRVTRAGADSTLARIVALVESAQLAKSRAQRLADQISAIFVPAILLAAVATFVGWLASGDSVAGALVPAVAVLVVACPCALGLATPVAVLVGSGRGAQLGLLVPGGEDLERVRTLRTVVLDKTGTLTLGRPAVVDIVALGPGEGDPGEGDLGDRGATTGWALRLAAAAEAVSEHPLARAVQAAAGATGTWDGGPSVGKVQVTAGAGISADVDGHRVAVGSPDWLAALAPQEASSGGVAHADHAMILEAGRAGARLAARGRTPVVVAVDGRARLVLGITDPLSPGAAAGVARLRAEGLRVVMATGDRPEVAELIGTEVGLDEVRAGLRPADKAALVRELQARDGPVAMVGDGVNDAPALATADLGIAVGTGSGVAVATAAITLVHGDIGAVADAIALTKAMHRVIRQNLGWAFGYNLVLVPLAALGILPPMVAALAMATSSVSVVTNALRLRRFHPGETGAGPNGLTARGRRIGRPNLPDRPTPGRLA